MYIILSHDPNKSRIAVFVEKCTLVGNPYPAAVVFLAKLIFFLDLSWTVNTGIALGTRSIRSGSPSNMQEIDRKAHILFIKKCLVLI